MSQIEHEFTKNIKRILSEEFGDKAEQIFSSCPILQYLNVKTKSAERGSKARGSFGNIYAIYVLVEDYVKKGFHKSGNYKEYEGAKFNNLLKRQRELPFGEKLQNHALNHRLNQEFKRYFPTCPYQPILRDVQKRRYWFNEKLLICDIGGKKYNIANTILKIIDEYIEVKQNAFIKFIETCEQLKNLNRTKKEDIIKFILDLLSPNVDARLFEIVSYSILKYYYHDQIVYFGFDLDSIEKVNLQLYKTGRCNANDGGIDFVMKPLGRFFQVTETVDVRKYFLDIDKIERYPITFVIKSKDSVLELEKKIREKAEEQYTITAIVEKYMECIEEIINIPVLIKRFINAVDNGYLNPILDEIIKQSKVEFNYYDCDDEEN